MFATPFEYRRCCKIDVGTCLGGVVTVAQVVDKAAVEVSHSSGKQLEIARDWEIIMQAVVPICQSGECIVVVHFVVRISQVCLEESLQGHVASHQPCHPHAFTGDTEIDTLVFLR